MLNKIKHKIKLIINSCFISIFDLKYNKKLIPLYDESTKNRAIDKKTNFKSLEKIELKEKSKQYKWVGGVNYNNYMYCIPNESNKILKVNMYDDSITYINFKTSEEGRRWSGGCIYKNKIYGFPRKSNKLICIDPRNNDEVSFIELNISYKKEHHYGGVLTKDGYIIQPPRNNNTILMINLNDYTSKEIKIGPKFIKYDYTNGILLENGLIYFFPTNGCNIMIFDYKKEIISTIGIPTDLSLYHAVESNDGQIIGFAGYKNEIVKINKNKVIKIKLNNNSGSYGTKIGINGKIYNIIGVGDTLYEYNLNNDKASELIQIDNTSKEALCAGGVISNDGTIYMVPAFGNTIYKIVFDRKVSLTKDQIELFNDYY